MDDAGVYRLSDDIAMVQTVDFFFPIVNDPRMNGLVAAANSLSDVWAMGAVAHTAMNVLAYPPGKIPSEFIEELLVGGSEKLKEAKVCLVGGHTMEQENVLYGMSVTGTVHPKKIKTNTNARNGDVIVLTKPLGTGIYSSALSKDNLSQAQYKEFTDSMIRLNKYASEILIAHDVSAMTDVTGFGLLGHSLPIARSSNLCIKFELDKIPFFSDIQILADKFGPKGISKTTEYTDPHTTKVNLSNRLKLELLSEAQTSGGLLAFVSQKDAEKVLKLIRECGDESAEIIGEAVARTDEHEFIRIV